MMQFGVRYILSSRSLDAASSFYHPRYTSLYPTPPSIKYPFGWNSLHPVSTLRHTSSRLQDSVLSHDPHFHPHLAGTQPHLSLPTQPHSLHLHSPNWRRHHHHALRLSRQPRPGAPVGIRYQCTSRCRTHACTLVSSSNMRRFSRQHSQSQP